MGFNSGFKGLSVPKKLDFLSWRWKRFFYYDATALVGHGHLIIGDSRSHSDTPHSVGLLWTSDQPNAETST